MSLTDVAGAVGEVSLRAAPVLALVLCLGRILGRTTSASSRRRVLLMVVLMLPALQPLGALLPDVVVGSPTWIPPTGFAPEGSPPGRAGLVSGLAALWLAGVVVMLVRLAVGWLTVHRAARSGDPLGEAGWHADRDGMAARLGLRRAPELRRSPVECVPHVWGVFRPVLVLPASADGWGARRRRAVLAHELAHVARREPAARLAAELVRALHWFDPLLRRSVTAFRREAELAADETALALGIEPRAYARELLALARERRSGPPVHAASAFVTRGEVERRVERILTRGGERAIPGSPRSLVGTALPTALVGLMALLVVPSFAPPERSQADRLAGHYGIPVALAAEIVAAAHEEGIPPGLAFGLVAEESGFDASRTSPRGAVGLTQILPSTAHGVRPGLSPASLRADSVNLRVGFRYLRSQIDRERGDIRLGLVAYAIGPARLDALRRRGRNVPLSYPARVLAHLDHPS